MYQRLLVVIIKSIIFQYLVLLYTFICVCVYVYEIRSIVLICNLTWIHQRTLLQCKVSTTTGNRLKQQTIEIKYNSMFNNIDITITRNSLLEYFYFQLSSLAYIHLLSIIHVIISLPFKQG